MEQYQEHGADHLSSLTNLIETANEAVKTGVYDGKDVTELTIEIEQIIKEAVRIRNAIVADSFQNASLGENSTTMDAMGEEWEVVAPNTSDTYAHTIATIRHYYGLSSKVFDQYHKPAKPFFMLGKYALTYCTGGTWALIPMLISNLG